MSKVKVQFVASKNDIKKIKINDIFFVTRINRKTGELELEAEFQYKKITKKQLEKLKE